ncbi:MAG: pirin family protein [Rhodocyclaceae bacterium]|nr:pirin family protein [Rhodocyclaceae bacterium]
MKQVLGVYRAPQPHWVGDGFPARTLFDYGKLGRQLSPFLLFDYAGPAHFEPAMQRRGVGAHPHRGFETVTLVYRGEVAHRDSTGEGGVIGPGDVQWMTAGAGILHEEYHSDAFERSGGELEMVQLWVNLPAREKATPPAYQAIGRDAIPVLPLPEDAGSVRVIAGAFAGRSGPARTFTPMNVWDLHLKAGARAELPWVDGWNGALAVLHGKLRINGETVVGAAELAVLDPAGDGLAMEASDDAVVLVLSGAPIDEPIVGHGPFVMNSDAEIAQALADFRSGRFGRIAPVRAT